MIAMSIFIVGDVDDSAALLSELKLIEFNWRMSEMSVIPSLLFASSCGLTVVVATLATVITSVVALSAINDSDDSVLCVVDVVEDASFLFKSSLSSSVCFIPPN